MPDRHAPRRDEAEAVAPTCRRCHRPLASPQAVAAGIGARCALLALTEQRQAAACGPTTAQTAVSLVAAHMARVDQETYTALLDGADTAEVAGLLAACAAIVLARTPGGPAWLADLGLAAAEGAAP